METTKNFEGKQAKYVLHSMYPYSSWAKELILNEQERTGGKTLVILDTEMKKAFYKTEKLIPK